MYFYKGTKCLYKVSFEFTQKEIEDLNIVEITKEEYQEEIAKVQGGNQE